MKVVLIYDETTPVPLEISRVIGANRFGDVVRRKQRLADVVEQMIDLNVVDEYVRLDSEDMLADVVGQLQRAPSDTMVFRLPSSIVPTSVSIFRSLIAKLPYSLGEAIFGDPNSKDAPALLSRDNAVRLLSERDGKGRKEFLRLFETHAMRVENQVGFIDISEIAVFLLFMSGATEARHFNRTSQSNGVFRKYSNDIAKMRAEYRFFHVVDEPMKRFLLPTFDFSEEDGVAAYSMESLSVPDAAIQLVHSTFDSATFARLMERFFSFIESRGRNRSSRGEVRLTGDRDISDKLARRHRQLLELPVGRQLEQWLAIAGPHGDMASLFSRCQTVLARELSRSDLDYLALSHGDPCFSNILYNPEIDLFRLIDPRGAESRDEALMHPLYDIAKFSHSVLGGYDFVNSGLAECKINHEMQISLTMHHGGPPSWMRNAFRVKLHDGGWDTRLVRAIEASLFLSMLPLHIDSPDKLPAFCLIAGEILAELEANDD